MLRFMHFRYVTNILKTTSGGTCINTFCRIYCVCFQLTGKVHSLSTIIIYFDFSLYVTNILKTTFVGKRPVTNFRYPVHSALTLCFVEFIVNKCLLECYEHYFRWHISKMTGKVHSLSTIIIYFDFSLDNNHWNNKISIPVLK